MKRALVLAGLAICWSIGAINAEYLSPEKEEQLRTALNGWIGRTGVSQSAAAGIVGEQPVKCGTPAFLTVNSLVRQASLEVQDLYSTFLAMRFDNQAKMTVGSPAGHFLVHYGRPTSPHAPYQKDVDVDSNGVPDYIDRTAMILDSVWAFEVDTLGFNAPPVDGFYPSGGDDRYDVYVLDIPTATGYQNIYGGTYEDSLYRIGTVRKATSFLILDNDYAHIAAYEGHPLDAIRVTAAHEFFHAIQFGYDPNESAAHTAGEVTRAHWLEMSAVWMEEQCYDDINDYYGYLGYFFNYIHLSLRTSPSDAAVGDYFQYASVTWPLFLSQNFGRDIVRTIWDSCATFYGPNVFENAFNNAIIDKSGGQSDFPKALGEFAVWNYFTGSRAVDGLGYSEAAGYPPIPDDWNNGTAISPYIQRFQSLPLVNYKPDEHGFEMWPDYLASSFVKVIPVGLDSLRFRLTGDQITPRTGAAVTWAVRAVEVSLKDGKRKVEIDPVSHENLEEFVVRGIGASSEIILAFAPFAQTERYGPVYHELTYEMNIPDSTIYVAGTEFRNPYPNPVTTSSGADRQVNFLVVTSAASSEEIRLDIFTIAGEKVFGLTKLIGDARVGQDIIVDWNGRNDSGEEVASGVYLAYVRVGSDSKVFKIAIVE